MKNVGDQNETGGPQTQEGPIAPPPDSGKGCDSVQRSLRKGDSVYYVMPWGGAIRPAVVVEVVDAAKAEVHLQVFTCAQADRTDLNVMMAAHVKHNQLGKVSNTWHWPE